MLDLPEECLVYYKDFERPFRPSDFPVEVLIDTGISNHTIQLLLDAVDRWNDRLNSEVLFVTITSDLYGMHGLCNFVVVNTAPFLPGDEDDVGLTSHGRCAADQVSIVTSDLTDEEIRTVAAHELGHVLGVPHDDNPASVMYPKLSLNEVFISERSVCVVKISLAVTSVT